MTILCWYSKSTFSDSREKIKKFLQSELDVFISQNMEKYFEVVQNRIESESEIEDSAVLVKALDKFCKKLQTANILTPRNDFTS